MVKLLFTSFALFLLCSFATGCTQNDIGPQVFEHYLYVLFEDESGENPMLSMEREEEVSPETEYSEYAKHLVLSKYYHIRQTGSSCHASKELGYTWLDGIAYANFGFATLEEEIMNQVIIIQCQNIFNDGEEHIIDADFAVVNEWPRKLDCVRFALDGVEYPVSPGGRVTVQLGR